MLLMVQHGKILKKKQYILDLQMMNGRLLNEIITSTVTALNEILSWHRVRISASIKKSINAVALEQANPKNNHGTSHVRTFVCQ